jgi:hypothetical protein
LNRSRLVLSAFLAPALFAGAAVAQVYPAKPMRLIASFLKAEHAKWGRVVRESGARAE